MEIVIIGGGFAGLNLAKELLNHKDINVTLVDKNNYNFFPPLIYQVATAFLEPSSISYPFRKFFAGKKNLQFRLGQFPYIYFNFIRIKYFYKYTINKTPTKNTTIKIALKEVFMN